MDRCEWMAMRRRSFACVFLHMIGQANHRRAYVSFADEDVRVGICTQTQKCGGSTHTRKRPYASSKATVSVIHLIVGCRCTWLILEHSKKLCTERR
eukprot:2382018-Pleurochrysis_carterae.AAC.1